MKIPTSKLEEMIGGKYTVIANLPYYITTPIIMKFIEESFNCESIVITIQKEVALRICAKEGTSSYGAITASINYYGIAKRLFDVTPDNFLPAPSVTSSVIRIELFDEIPYQVDDEKTLFEVIAGAFAQRRKTLSNSLSSHISYIPKARICEIIVECGFDANIRGERLSITDFCTLANAIYKEKKK
jgi:16S rRNA (adenine1518-N6/adenine1519-N6)-dimethyltransferase